MSRSAHEQSDFRLRKLPRCSRCNKEFVLVLASYEKLPKPIYEWECTKCHKVVEKHLLKEAPLNEDERFFDERAERDRK